MNRSNMDNPLNPPLTRGNFEPEQPRKKFWKFWLIMVLFSIGFILLIGKLFYIQIINADYYKALAKRQHESKIDLIAERGNIYDRNGKLLASNLKTISVAIDPALFLDTIPEKQKEKNELKNQICSIISKITGESTKSLLDRINSSNSRFVWLARELVPSQVGELKKLDAKGLILREDPKRYYVYGNAAAQILGYTNIDNIGISGVEKRWDSLLIGQNGYMIMHKDAKGMLRPSADLPYIPALNGNSLQLTIDIDLQRIVEYELEQGVKNSEAESGTVAMMNPETGEILAMASYPGFDPNSHTSTSLSMTEQRIRAITDVYEPGSTFKVVTSAAALEEKVTDTNTIYDGKNGLADFGNYTIRDDHAMGWATMSHALMFSSNIIFSEIANKMNGERFYGHIRDFGFGSKLGIDIPGEASGRVQKPDRFNQMTKRYVGHGYGISATALQILSAYATVANGGTVMKPFIVRKAFNQKGEQIFETKINKGKKIISDITSKKIIAMMCGVVEGGTGTKAKIEGLKIAGKTGTSQQYSNKSYVNENYTATFVGFFPADRPKIVMLVMLDKPQGVYYGGAVSAPIFHNIVLRWLMVSPELAGEGLRKKDGK